MIAHEMEDAEPRVEWAVVVAYPSGGGETTGMVTDRDLVGRRVAAHRRRGARVSVMRRVWTPSEWVEVDDVEN